MTKVYTEDPEYNNYSRRTILPHTPPFSDYNPSDTFKSSEELLQDDGDYQRTSEVRLYS